MPKVGASFHLPALAPERKQSAIRLEITSSHDSLLEGDGFELPVREHRDSRMCTHLVVNHRVAVHVPVLICRFRRGGANNSKLELLLGQASPTASAMMWASLITGTGSKLRWPSSFRAAAENFGEMAFEATAADRTPRHGQDGCRWDRP